MSTSKGGGKGEKRLVAFCHFLGYVYSRSKGAFLLSHDKRMDTLLVTYTSTRSCSPPQQTRKHVLFVSSGLWTKLQVSVPMAPWPSILFRQSQKNTNKAQAKTKKSIVHKVLIVCLLYEVLYRTASTLL